MIDVTQSMACIHCGACVSDCLSMEVDPLFIGPAALAKAYRFVGDPRDAQDEERLRDLAEDPHGIYDCTHCFNCIEVCPKGVAPMDQIMRLRRRATRDFEINGPEQRPPPRARVHEHHPQEGHPRRAQAAAGQLRPVPAPGRDRADPRAADRPARLRARQDHAEDGALHEKLPGIENVQRIYDHAEQHHEELNLYIVGEGGDAEEKEPAMGETPEVTT